MEHQDELSVGNSGDGPLSLVIEPWGMILELPAGEVWKVSAQGSQPGKLELMCTEEAMVVCGWPSSTIVVRNGDTTVYEGATPVPEVPPGMSVAQFMGLLFGQAGD